MIVGQNSTKAPAALAIYRPAGREAELLMRKPATPYRAKAPSRGSQTEKQDTRAHSVHPTGQSSETGPLLAVAFSGGMAALLGLGSLIR
jgi:hypothetical protein